MGGVKVKNGLDRYLEKLKKHKGRYSESKITRLVGTIGVQTAREEYSASGVSPTSLRAETREGGVDIVATGEHLAFSEYGTGVVGKGTYEGELPTQKLEFESPSGVQQSTEGWQYNYRKEQGQTEMDWTGFRANAQMFKTSRRLQTELPSEIMKEIKGEN